jgi:hypothetical protein
MITTPTTPSVAPSYIPAPTPETKQPKHHFPIIIFLFVLSIILTATTGYLLYQNIQLSQKVASLDSTNSTVVPPTQITPNQLSYSNSILGYSFNYSPNPNLKRITCNDNSSEKLIFDEANSTFPECGNGDYSWPISIYLTDSDTGCGQTASWDVVENQFQVAGISARKCESNFVGERLYPGPSHITTVIIPFKNQFLQIELTNDKYASTYNQILSTLKFN